MNTHHTHLSEIFTARIAKIASLGAAAAGLFLTGAAQAQAQTIQVVNGGPGAISTTASGAGNVITNNFTITAPANALVVELWDRNQQDNHSSPYFVTWSNATAGTVQTAIRCVSEVSGTSTYSDCDIYYLYNPTPGTGVLTAIDTNNASITIQGLVMMPVTLSGVDTTILPATNADNGAGATSLTANTAGGTLAGSFAAVISYFGEQNADMTNASTSGISVNGLTNIEHEECVGYVTGLAAGSSTITMSESNDGAQKCTLAVAIFAPNQGINLQDGSTATTGASGGPSVTISNFTVTAGASVLVVNLFDRDGSSTHGSPSTVPWGSQTLTRVVSENNGASTYADSDIFILWNPAPGTQNITASDTSGGVGAMTMQAYDLNGVNTNDQPVIYATNYNGTENLSLTTTSTTPFGSWIDIDSSYGTGNASPGLIVTASDGFLDCPAIDNTTEQSMGYDALAFGATTVTATDNDGDQKMALALAVFTPNVIETPPSAAAPINPAALGQIHQVTLTWLDGSGGLATSYIIFRSTTSGSGYVPIGTNAGNTATTYVDTTGTPNVPSYYVIEAVNVLGVASAYSAQVNAVSAVPLGPPNNVEAIAQTNQVLVEWTDSTGGQATGYVILRSTSLGGAYGPIATNSGNADTTFIDNTVLDGTAFYYEVESLSGTFAGTASTPPASATPFYALPSDEAGTLTLLDGGESSLTVVTANSTISINYNVSAEASVMVAELWDQNGEANHSSPATLTWNNSSGQSQTLVRAVSENNDGSPYSDVDIYYLFNPSQGSGQITGTDPNTTAPTGMSMIAFDLTGVNTAIPPVVYGVDNSSSASLSVALSSNTPAGSWAAVITSDANSASAINITTSSGTVTQGDVNNSQTEDMGYAGGLHGGSGTISMSATGGASRTAMAAAVFAPAIGTGIFLQDGSIDSVASTTTTTNAVLPFKVTEGASMMVCEVYDENNDTSVPGPTIVWSNMTLGTTQVLTADIQTNNTQYTWMWCDLYYLMDPTPGQGVVVASDGSLPIGNTLEIVTFDLGGVDTTQTPYGAGVGESQAYTLSVNTPGTTEYGSWAAVMSEDNNGGEGNNITITANTGGPVETNYYPANLQCVFGYLTNLGAGAGTITGTAVPGGPTAATHMMLAGMVIAPLPGTLAPIDVTASGELNQILLTWQDGSGGSATAYYVLRSTNSLSGFVTVATNTGNGATSFTDTGVIDWTTYYYEVQATGPAGLSLFSAVVSTNALGIEPPPSSLAANGEINSDLLTWNPQLGTSLFDIYRSTASGSGFTLIGTSAATNFTDLNVTDGTEYYYEIAASNSYGKSGLTAQVSAVPVVAFFTNWIGIFDTTASVTNWNQFDGATNTQTEATFVSGDTPSPSVSTGCLLFSSEYGGYTTNDLQGIATNFPALNVSTYRNIEFDVKNVGPWDQSGQIQGVEVNLEVPVAGVSTYEEGTAPAIVLYENGTGAQWTHYVVPVTNWDAYTLTALTGFGLNVYDESFEFATPVGVEFDNIEFSQAPAWAPSISVTNQVAPSGSASVALAGTVSATVAGAPVYLAQGTPISVTIHGSTQTTSVSDATGDFVINFNTTGFAIGVYPITYVSASDNVALIGATNTSTTLSLSSAAPSPTIQPPTVVNGNLQVKVSSLSGYNYYLLNTTNLAPPAVWTTNTFMAGTGGVITFSVPILANDKAMFFKLEVQ